MQINESKTIEIAVRVLNDIENCLGDRNSKVNHITEALEAERRTIAGLRTENERLRNVIRDEGRSIHDLKRRLEESEREGLNDD